jgi:hypothetical protein
VALPACDRCGNTNPHKMIGLMTLWFGSFVDLPPDHGYFYLCPTCYDRWVKPHFDLIQGRLAELHPTGHHLDRHGLGDTEPEPEPEPEPPPPVAAGGAGDEPGDEPG